MMDTRDRLDRALKNLPREGAREGFTDQVLRASRQSRPGTALLPAWWRRGPVLVLAGCVAVLALGLGVTLNMMAAERQRRADLRREIAELREEHKRLGVEVSRLRQQPTRQVIYLGGDDTVDYELDLDRLRRQGAAARPVPAMLEVDLEQEEPAWPGSEPYAGGAL